jgi:hypothetical protein
MSTRQKLLSLLIITFLVASFLYSSGNAAADGTGISGTNDASIENWIKISQDLSQENLKKWMDIYQNLPERELGDWIKFSHNLSEKEVEKLRELMRQLDQFTTTKLDTNDLIEPCGRKWNEVYVYADICLRDLETVRDFLDSRIARRFLSKLLSDIEYCDFYGLDPPMPLELFISDDVFISRDARGALEEIQEICKNVPYNSTICGHNQYEECVNFIDSLKVLISNENRK